MPIPSLDIVVKIASVLYDLESCLDNFEVDDISRVQGMIAIGSKKKKKGATNLPTVPGNEPGSRDLSRFYLS